MGAPIRVATWATVAMLCGCNRPAQESPAADAPPPTESAAAAAPRPADSSGIRAAEPERVTSEYMMALLRRDFARAASLWVEGATEGAGDSAAFRRAHGDTTFTSYEGGVAGRIEAAAGSHYVKVPVVARGTVPDRPPLLLHGIVTLRRSMVDGATAEQRQWRIMRIEWSTSGKPPQ